MTLKELGKNNLNNIQEGSSIGVTKTEGLSLTKVVAHRQTGKIAEYIEIDYDDLGRYINKFYFFLIKIFKRNL